MAYIYSVGSSSTFCYASNLLAICIQTAVGNICFTFVAYAFVLIHEEVASFYAVYSQSLLQRQTSCCNLKIIFAFLQFYSNCIVFSANANAVTCCIGGVFCIYGVDILSICSCSFFYRSDIGTCFYLGLSCCADVFQLTIVYCISICCTCCYISNLLGICVQTAAGDICFFAITNTCIRHIEVACFYAVYSQILLQRQTICCNLKIIFAFLHVYSNCILFSANANAVACCIGGVFCIYCVDILSIISCSFYYGSVSTCFYLGLSCCAYLIQLAYIYSVIIINTICYIGNRLAICIQTAVGNICFTIVAYAFVLIHEEVACFYAVYSQSLLQCQASCCNLKIIFAFLHVYSNCILFSANANAVACCIGGVFCIYCVDILSIISCSFYYGSVSTCFYLGLSCCAYLIQLAYIYSVIIINTICYIGNRLAICIQTAVGNICFTIVAYAFVLIHEELSCFYAVYSQVFIQLYLYIFASIAYFDVIISTAEFYGITSSYLSCCTVICCYCPAFTNFGCQIIYFFVGCVQLAKVYCIFRFSAVCYILDSAVTVKGILVNLNIAAIKANAACASAIDGFNTSQSSVQCQTVAINYEVRVILQLNRNSIRLSCINFNTIAFGIGGIGSTDYITIYCYVTASLINFIVNCILLTINLNAGNTSTSSCLCYLYLRASSKGLLSCAIRNLNKSITAASTATAGNANSTFNRRTCVCIAISQQADSCRIFIFSQSNFFNIVTIQLFFIFQ